MTDTFALRARQAGTGILLEPITSAKSVPRPSTTVLSVRQRTDAQLVRLGSSLRTFKTNAETKSQIAQSDHSAITTTGLTLSVLPASLATIPTVTSARSATSTTASTAATRTHV